MGSTTSRTFSPDAEQIGSARRFAMGVVRGWGLASDDVGLVVSELAANAVLHARSSFDVSLYHEGRRVVVEIADSNPRPPAMATFPPSGPSGRGLVIVDRLSTAWGVVPLTSRGKVVWAEVDCT